MNILALDMATRTGWAIKAMDSEIVYGVKDYSPYTADWGGLFAVHHKWLSDTIAIHSIQHVVIERNFFRGKASQLFAGLNAITHMVAFMHDVDRSEVAPTELKKFVTGTGKSKKPEIVKHVREWGFDTCDDNEADAIALLHLAIWRIDRERAAA